MTFAIVRSRAMVLARPFRRVAAIKSMSSSARPQQWHTPLAFARNHAMLPSRTQSNPLISKRLLFSSTPEWHRPSFMENASLEEKETWLNSLIRNQDERLDSQAYLVVLRDLPKSNQSGAPQRAEEWMRRLESSSGKAKPTVECYNCVIQSWANSGEDASLALIRAERWLSKLQKQSQGEHVVTANTESYNAFLNACSKGRVARRNASNAREHAKKAQETLEYMIQQQEEGSPVIPDTDSFNYVIRALTRCRDDATVAQKVMNILKQMTEYQRADPEHSPVKPNTKSYTMAMDAFCIAAGRKAKQCLNSRNEEDWQDPSKNGLQEIEMIEDLLSYMHKLHETGGLDYAMPNAVTYNVLISAWARVSGPLHPNAPLRAEKVLRKMIALREDYHFTVAPDVHSYTKVILAWTNLGRDTAGKRAQWWLKKLYDEYEVAKHDDRLRPTVGAYNAVIKAWAKVGRPKHAEMLLVDLIRNEKNENVPCLKPNSESFSTVIHAWLKVDPDESHNDARRIKGCKRAAEWLDELIRREEDGSHGLTTSPELFDGVLKSTSKCQETGPDILGFSISILERYRTSRHRVNCRAYVWLLQIGLNTLGTTEYDDTRFDFLQQLFSDCCDDGLLSNVFVQTLANGPVYYDGWTRGESAMVVQELFPDWPLPWEWSRNLPNQYNIPRIEDTERRRLDIRLRDRPERHHA